MFGRVVVVEQGIEMFVLGFSRSKNSHNKLLQWF